MKTEAQLFKALADETLLQILGFLMGEDELCVQAVYQYQKNVVRLQFPR